RLCQIAGGQKQRGPKKSKAASANARVGRAVLSAPRAWAASPKSKAAEHSRTPRPGGVSEALKRPKRPGVRLCSAALDRRRIEHCEFATKTPGRASCPQASAVGTKEWFAKNARVKSASKLDALHTLRAVWGQRTSRQRMECVQLAGAFQTARTTRAATQKFAIS